MIISFSGKIGSGKDLAGNICKILLQSPHLNNEGVETFLNKNLYESDGNWEIRKWADKLKDIVCTILNCSREQLENRAFKETKLGEEWDKFKVVRTKITKFERIDEVFYFSTIEEANKFKLNNLNYDYFGEIEKVEMTPRLMLQLLGTECGRNIIHPDLWILTLMQDYKGDTEIWKPIEDYEDSYEISSFGRVKSLDRKIVYGEYNGQYHTKKSQILKPTLSSGYETVSLSGKTFTVHSLVAKHFVEGYQEGFVVNHIDYNKTNNFYKNLEWITQKDNIKHNKTTLRGNFGERQKDVKLDIDKVIAIRKLLEEGTLSQNRIAKLFEVSPTTITDIKKGRKWNHVGREIPIISPIIPKPLPNFIITDTRFENELEAVKKREGIIIRINRVTFRERTTEIGKIFTVVQPEVDELLGIEEHPSETALDNADFDYVIDNNGTISELIDKIRNILIENKLIKNK